MGAFLFRSGFAHADNVITKRCSKTITWLPLSRLQIFRNLPEVASGTCTHRNRNPPEPSGTCLRNLHHAHRNPPEPSGTCLRNQHQHTPEPSRTFRNLPPEPTPLRSLEPSGTFRNLPPEPTPPHTGTLRNLPEPASGTYTTAQPGTVRNLPEPASGTYTSAHRNPPEPSGTCLQTYTPEPSGTFRNLPRNLHQRTLEPSGTFWNLPPEPAPATRTGTHRSLSGLKTPLAYAVGEKQLQQFERDKLYLWARQWFGIMKDLSQ